MHALATCAADLVVAQELPAASEVTWINNFSMFSLGFATYCVIESVVVHCHDLHRCAGAVWET